MFERIVAAIDNDAERAGKVVEAAGEVARARHAPVVVVHVREIERPTALATGVMRPGVLPPALVLESEEEARALVDAAVARLHDAGVVAQGQVQPGGTGSTAQELLEIARAQNATLIVVGDRNSRVSDVLLGGVAHRIVHLAPCSVLLVR
jgi:nucleotide-binding universal stress UspA family protein